MRKSLLPSLLLSGFVWAMTAVHVNAGYVTRLFYDGITGTSISNLTTNPIFPDGSTFSDTIGNLPDANGMYFFESVNGAGDNYGSWTRGYLEAPLTGPYTFWLESDDAGQFWLSTDTTQAHTNLIAQLVDGTYASVRQWDKYPSQKSTNVINLVKGQKYYFEILHKDGTGGDHLAVGWTLPDGRLQRPLPGYALFPYLDAGTTFSISQQPQSLTVEEGRPAVLFVNVDAPSPNVAFQWYKNSIAIAGATLSSYVIDRVLLSDAAEYKVKVTYSGQAPFSDPATLTVIQDVTAPTIVSVDTRGYDTLLDVVFSETVTPASATNLANYSFDGGVTVASATLLEDGASVRLRTSQLDVSSPHTLTVNGVRDFASTPNVIANASVTFGATKGSIYARVYTGITAASTIAALTNAASFPNSPNIITNLPAFESPVNWMDSYGMYIQGWLAPDTSGNYSFASAVDDTSIVSLSTDENPANKRAILVQPANWAGTRDYNKYPAEQQTASTATPTYSLVAGRKYYIEMLMNGGTGGDNLALAWQLGGGNIANSTDPIPGANLIPYVAANIPLTIATHPQSQTIFVFRPVTFTAATMGSPNYTWAQWYRNGQPISGANGLTYTINSVAASDDGAVFSFKATNLVYSAASSNAVLTVNSDLTPPGLASVNSLDGATVGVVFDEQADTNTTRVAGNYTVTGATVTGATPSADGRWVMLTLAGKAPNQFTVTVSNVKDLAGNTIVAGSSIQGNVLNLTVEGIANTLPEQMTVTTPGYLQVVASGADIWAAGDQFVFAHLTMTGDFDYRLNVRSMSNPNVWAKAGIMVRESNDTASKHIINATTPQAGNNYSTTQYRPLNGGATSYTAAGGTPAATYPNTWLRLKRVGDLFYSYWSANGTDWTVYSTNDTTTGNWTAGPMPQTVLLGIATCSHSTTANVTAQFSDFGMLPQVAVSITNQPVAAINRAQNTPLTITVGAAGDPIRYQWQKNGTDIPNANAATFRIDLLQTTDAGTYSVRVFNDTSFVISSNCVVTVSTDILPPALVGVAGDRNFNTVTVAFSEPMDQATAENPANYVLSGGLTVQGAVRQANLTNVVLTTSQQTSGTSYTLTINNVTDLAGNPLPANANRNFTGFVLASGAAVEEIYNTSSTVGTVADLLANANFAAGTPSTSALVNSLDIWSQGGTIINGVLVVATGYGGRFHGWLTPTVSGSYTFGIASDDGGALYLSTNDQPVDKNTVAPIATVSTDGTINTTAYTGQRVWNKYPTDQVSAPVQLQAGQKYFLDAVWKNGGGGNGCSVGWTTPNNATMGVIPIAYLSAYANPDLATISITQQPTNATVLQSRPVTFAIAVAATSELGTNVNYQWQTNGVDIAGATAATYTIPVTALAHSGITFTCKLSVPTKTLVSEGAVLTVTADQSAPGIVAVGGLAGSKSVVVRFDEYVDAATANNPANYTVNGSAPTSAVLSSRMNLALLKVTSLSGTTANVTVSGIKDLAGNTMTTPVAITGPVTSLSASDVGTPSTNNPAVFSDPLEIGMTLTRSASDFDMIAGGHDIWDAADGCHFLYKQTTGDFDVKVRVASLQMINTWSKAGLMVREGLGGTNRMMNLLVTPLASEGGQNVTGGQQRTTNGVAATDIVATTIVPRPVGVPYPNAWLRIQRVGASFFLYLGTNGTTWTPFVTNTPAVAYPATVYVGATATSHDNGANRTTFAEFRDLTFAGEVVPVNPPTMTWSRQGNLLTLGWPADAIGFKLQSSAAVPATAWQDVAGSEATNAVAITIGAGNQYYRLKQ